MAQGVVDVLEAIEVEHVGGDHLAAPGASEGMVEPLIEQDAIGQARQRIVPSHVCDLGLASDAAR